MNGSFSTPIVKALHPSAVIAVAALLLIVAFVIVRPVGTPGPAMRDFEAYYSAGVVAQHGGDPYGRDIWEVERTIPGVDPSHNETLPFVGPPASLFLWRTLALLPYSIAGRVWGATMALTMMALILASLELAGAQRRPDILIGAYIFVGSYGPLTSDIALGQVALLSGAGVVLTLLLFRTRRWWTAAFSALAAALQPNLGLVLVVVRDARAWAAFALGFILFAAATALEGGLPGFVRYLDLLRAHGAAEHAVVIQITPGSIAYGFGAGETAARVVAVAAALAALVLVALALRAVRRMTARVALAICALPFILPFFHEHDFLLTILPALWCAIVARGRALGFAAFFAVASGIDWLGLGQRPLNALQSVVLCATCGLGFALVARLRAAAFAGLLVVPFVAAVSLIAATHPVPIWPDGLPPHWVPPVDADISRVWELSQIAAGLTAQVPLWDVLRALSLLSTALLGFAVYRISALPGQREVP
ncbi:MAG: DUF2029 domain-containing protein [Candidatus Eremiobacteraeota bacterium]|nr:DUF2029 domain-containing protein [Candidatus Eremiobacteraeota bacterium]